MAEKNPPMRSGPMAGRGDRASKQDTAWENPARDKDWDTPGNRPEDRKHRNEIGGL